MPYCPFVALKCTVKDSSLPAKICGKSATRQMRSRLDLLVRQMDSSGFIIRIFKGVEDGIYFVTFSLSLEELIQEAKN
jgi:hypothetical protein